MIFNSRRTEPVQKRRPFSFLKLLGLGMERVKRYINYKTFRIFNSTENEI